MKPLHLKILAILVLALAALAAGMLFSARQPAAPPPTQGAEETEALQKLLALRLPTPQGEEISLDQWQGKTLVINFWATWCPPCKDEMPAFSRLHTQYQAQGVQFVGIAIDSMENVQAFAQQYPVAYPLVVGGNGAINLAKALGNRQMGLPFTLVVDARGQVRARKLGGIQEAALNALIQEALQGKQK